MGWQRCDEKTAHRAVFSFLAVDVVTAWLCTMTSLPKIVTTRDFVGHVMPIDTQYFAVEKQQHSQTPGSACRRHLRIVAKRVRNASTRAWPICTNNTGSDRPARRCPARRRLRT